MNRCGSDFYFIYNYGGCSSAVERRSVAADVAGSNPVSHPSKTHLLIAGVFCYHGNMISPFPYSYITWLSLFVIVPTIILWIFNFSYFSLHKKVFGLAILGSVIFSFPWDFIAIKEQIWLFEKPYIIGWHIIGLPIEEWIFISVVTILFTCFTLLLWKKMGRNI